jgi:hypothetical protein
MHKMTLVLKLTPLLAGFLEANKNNVVFFAYKYIGNKYCLVTLEGIETKQWGQTIIEDVNDATQELTERTKSAYYLINWTNVQDLMNFDWFPKEAVIHPIIDHCYFIPADRMDDVATMIENTFNNYNDENDIPA